MQKIPTSAKPISPSVQSKGANTLITNIMKRTNEESILFSCAFKASPYSHTHTFESQKIKMESPYELEPNMKDQTWDSNPFFEYTEMSGIHKAANSSQHSIFPTYGEYEGFYLNEDDILDFSGIEWNDSVWENSGPVAYTAVLITLAVIFTIGGIVFCFMSRCCCFCRKPDFEPVSPPGCKNKLPAILCGLLMAVWVIFYM